MKFYEKKTFLKNIKKCKYDVLTLKDINNALKLAEINNNMKKTYNGSFFVDYFKDSIDVSKFNLCSSGEKKTSNNPSRLTL